MVRKGGGGSIYIIKYSYLSDVVVVYSVYMEHVHTDILTLTLKLLSQMPKKYFRVH